MSGTIKQANQFLDCSNIWTSTPICIPNGPYNAPACSSTYISAAGDTCSSIETKYNLVDGTIQTANSFLTCTDIWTYTPICIPDGPYNQFECKTTYISMAGDTCATIDNEFNLIDGITKAANAFLTCSDIWTATPICIPNGPYNTNYEPNCVTQAYVSLAGETWCVEWLEYYRDMNQRPLVARPSKQSSLSQLDQSRTPIPGSTVPIFGPEHNCRFVYQL